MLKNKLLAIFALILLLSTYSCQKFCKPIPPPAGDNDTHCQITKIDITGYYGYPDEYLFYYNSKGNPDSILDTNPVDNLGDPRFFFRYDHQERLSDYMLTNQATSQTGAYFAILWHKYAYPSANFVTDTLLEYAGDVRGPEPSSANTFLNSINAYTLDTKGRIIKIWGIANDSTHAQTLLQTITYDANGNPPLPSTDFSYDDKVNFFRTNKVFQFVNRDYSHNNRILTDPSFVTAYNDLGLPLHMKTWNPSGAGPFNVWNTAPSFDISYACPMPKGPINY